MSLRPDLAVIAAHVTPGSRVLDIGCGDGALMLALRDLGCDVRGIEIDGASVERCVSQGLSVVQGDADRDLHDYPDKGFDYAVLSQTLQTAVRPDRMLDELLRVGGGGARRVSGGEDGVRVRAARGPHASSHANEQIRGH